MKNNLKGELKDITKMVDVKVDPLIEFNEQENPTIPVVKISEVTLEFEDKMIEINGILRSNTAIQPKTLFFNYSCTRCDLTYSEKQKNCDCGGFLKKTSERINLITAIFEEDNSQSTVGRITTSIILEFTESVNKTINQLILGNKYKIIGKLMVATKGKKDYFVLRVEEFTRLKEGLLAIPLTKSDKEKIEELSQRDDLIPKLRKAVFGEDLYNLDLPMESILLTMASSPKNFVGETMKNRGNLMHLFVGSPGKGKSQLLKRAANFFPKSRYATGSGSSAIGLVASVQKDERVGDFVLTPGTVALCHEGGIAALDEIDKIDKADLTKLNTMMDSLIIPIDKANIHRSIPADVSILAAMNPKYGSFDDNELPYNQINLKKDFLDRFDLIFNIDYFNKGSDSRKIAESSLKAYLNRKKEDVLINSNIAKKYFVYARRIVPKMDMGILTHIEEEFHKLTGLTNNEGVYYSLRLLDNLVRLVGAYSRLRLSDKPDYIDVKKAIELMKESFKSMGIFSDGEGLNQYVTEKVVEPKKIDKLRKVRKIIHDLGEGRPVLVLDVEDVYGRDDFDEILELLKRNGEITEPRRGYVKNI